MLSPDAPHLKGWLTLPQVATALSVTRQAVHKMVRAEKFETIHRLGDEIRPFYVVSAVEVQKIAVARQERAKEREEITQSA